MLKKLSVSLISIALASGSAYASQESKSWDASKKAQAFVKESLVMDMFASPYGAGWTEDKQMEDYIQRAIDTGISGVSATLAATYYTFEQFEAERNKWQSVINKHPDTMTVGYTVEDIKQAKENGKYVFIWNSQTPTILNGDLNKVATVKAMGVNTMQLVYNGRYRTGLGVIEALHYDDIGLSDWGRSLIDEMVKNGILVDMSHTSYQTTMDIMSYMEEKHPGVPAVFTHSGPAGLYECSPKEKIKKEALAPCYRLITDEQAIRVAKMGGVVSPTFTEWMLDGIFPDDITPAQAADMLEYYIKLVGIDHVGIATDDMFSTALVKTFAKNSPQSYNDFGYMIDAFDRGADSGAELAKFLPALTDELWKRGYKNEDILKMYSGNLMRVWEQTW
ncbi:dipeptidase [Aliivibrio sp. EL58]|jgi:membrane dipeptidase|uniref:dipeptidase n=1 Tax=Aliivibrio sp. EL58 TaxID=2107582 RepID=UPI000EFC0FAF|nr:membrane dipeptidase [Aliivibrio sp. EL58]